MKLEELPLEEHVAKAKLAWTIDFATKFCGTGLFNGEVMSTIKHITQSLEKVEAEIRAKRGADGAVVPNSNE